MWRTLISVLTLALVFGAMAAVNAQDDEYEEKRQKLFKAEEIANVARQRATLAEWDCDELRIELVDLDWHGERQSYLAEVSQALHALHGRLDSKAEEAEVQEAKESLQSALNELREVDAYYSESWQAARSRYVEDPEGLKWTLMDWEGGATESEKATYAKHRVARYLIRNSQHRREIYNEARRVSALALEDLAQPDFGAVVRRLHELEGLREDSSSAYSEMRDLEKRLNAAAKEGADTSALQAELDEKRKQFETLEEQVRDTEDEYYDYRDVVEQQLIQAEADWNTLAFMRVAEEGAIEEANFLSGKKAEPVPPQLGQPGAEKLEPGQPLRGRMRDRDSIIALDKAQGVNWLSLGIGAASALTENDRKDWLKNCMEAIARHKGLKILQLSLPNDLSATDIEPLTTLPAVESLSLDFKNITPELLDMVGRIKVSGTLSVSGPFDGEEWASAVTPLAQAPHLEVSFRGPAGKSANEVLASIGRLPNLAALSFSVDRHIVPETMVAIAASKSLKRLLISGKLNRAQFTPLRQASTLESLTLSFCQIGDDWLAGLNSKKTLRRLSLVGCVALTERCLSTLDGMSLERLDLSLCSGIPEWALQVLGLRTPECEMLPESNFPLR